MGESKLPKTRKGRVSLILRDSTKYIRLMGRVEVDKLLLGLSKTKGLSVHDQNVLEDELFNVDYYFVAERLKY